jgi:hypothetical protein
MRKIALLILTGIGAAALTGCQPAIATPAADALTAEGTAAALLPAGALDIRLVPAEENADPAERLALLCAIEGPGPTCTLAGPPAAASAGGTLHFDGLTPGPYAVLIETGWADFSAAAERLSGAPIEVGNWRWIRSALLALPEGDTASVIIPAALESAVTDRAAYGLTTLLFEGSPFMLAHAAPDPSGSAISPLIVAVGSGDVATVEIPLYAPTPLDPAALRAEIGPLDRAEAALFDRALAERWSRFIAGDDSAYRDTDAQAIRDVRAGRAHDIGSALLAALEEQDGALVKRTAYLTIDVLSGEPQVIGWLDPASGDVIEAATGYRLNVRDDPGEWIETGPDGEQFYCYGFSWYRRWGQILPDPVIALIEDFYDEGLRFVERSLGDYRAVAESFGGDLNLVEWDASTLALMANWRPGAPPFVHLPDSGTVDIRRERFLAAQIDGAVVVDEERLASFISSDYARSGLFIQTPDPQEVRDALLTPYRSGHLFSDLEAAIILEATYGGPPEPLAIHITGRLDAGFMVPRGQDKTLLISSDEVANVLLGYPGALNSRWAHEMGHIVDFRAEQYDFRGRPAAGSRCEPVKYLMEFMWWVQRYPGDAPDWDWRPINSGLTLARLLTESFHNSGC